MLLTLRSIFHLFIMTHNLVEEAHKQVLGLKLPTDPRWVDLAQISLGDILTDHAYCEQKAAANCMSLIQGYPDYIEMVRALAPIVTEEWGHFRLVLAELDKRNLILGKQRRDEYVNALREFQTKGGDRNLQFIDKLIICALIEARSCERFRMLSLNISEKPLRDFYHKFMVSEAGHYRLFLDLAHLYSSEEYANIRWQQCLTFEAEIIRNLEVRGDRIH